jgi:hypothetical protein
MVAAFLQLHSKFSYIFFYRTTLLFFSGHTLSVCLSEDLEQLIQEVEQGDLNTAKKSLQDSLTSHWQEKGGRGSCYVTKKEDKLISIFTS